MLIENRVYLRAYILRTGLVLADLPGKIAAKGLSLLSFCSMSCVVQCLMILPTYVQSKTRKKKLCLRIKLTTLAGLQDLNFARLRATERYMRSCDEVFAVTTIYRTITDTGISDIISRCAKLRPLRIVCTRSEVRF
jgi:hypothetical protein